MLKFWHTYAPTQTIFFLTVSGHVQLHEVLQVLNVWREAHDLVVAQAQLAKAVQPEEVLQRRDRSAWTGSLQSG